MTAVRHGVATAVLLGGTGLVLWLVGLLEVMR